jgi:hypothetical protein
MAEDKNKSLRDILFRTILSAASDKGEDSDTEARRGFSPRLDIGTAKELIASVASWAGKGKDELVQMLFREIGQAVAAMLKEPLTQVIENRKLQITLEFAPRKSTKGKESEHPARPSRPGPRRRRKT